MKKITSFVIGLTLTSAALAQTMTSYIPQNSDFVGRINSERILKLLPEDHFNQSDIGKLFYEKISKSNSNVKSLKDFGVNLEDGFYYFSNLSDSINYFTAVIDINDFSKFKSVWLNELEKDFSYENGFYISESNSTSVTISDDRIIFVGGDCDLSYFKNNPKYASEVEDESSYYGYYDVKSKYQGLWVSEFADKIKSKSFGKSIESVKGFKKAVNDKKSAATFWISDYNALMQSTVGKSYGKYYAAAGLNISGLKTGLENLAVKVKFNENNIEIVSDVTVSKDMRKSFKALYGPKLDKDLWSSFDAQSSLMYCSISMSTEGVLKEYPEMMGKMYNDLLPAYSSEIEIGKEIFQILLDEESIGELITGDAIFSVSDFSMVENTYKTYEYDDNFEYKEIEKTRKEPLPNLMLTIGTKKEELVKNILSLGSKYKVIDANNGIYTLRKIGELPFDLYFGVKSGAFLASTNLEDLKNVLSNKKYKLGIHKKDLKNSSTQLFINSERIISNIAEQGLEEQMVSFKDYLDLLGNINFTSSRVKCGGHIYSKVVVNTKDNADNTLLMLFDLANEKVAKK